MKKYILGTFASLVVFSAFSQETKEEPPLQYPFDETGTENPRGVYGIDNRKEVKDADGIKDFVRATAAMIPKSLIRDNKVYGYTLRERLTQIYGSPNFHPNVKFLDQPTSAACTGFLIAPDLLVTAGHCVKSPDDIEDYVWIFDYTNELGYNDWFRYIEVDPNNVYEATEVITTVLDDTTLDDYAVLRLDRESSRLPYRFRTSGKVGLFTRVNTIGTPTGLPLKFADNAIVVDDAKSVWFKTNIDAFPGNSGGPVFSKLGFIEGILVRGATTIAQDGSKTPDYMYDWFCNCIKTVEFSSTYQNAGVQAHRITSIPYDILHEAIYDNIEYAIINQLDDRLNSWIAYDWMIDHEYTNKRGRFELIAGKYNNLNALKIIVEKSSSQDALDKYGYDLLIYAIDYDNKDMVDYLIDHVSFLEMLKNDYQSPLFYAFERDRIDIVISLLDNGWNPNSKDSKGNNLLHLAAYENDLSLIQKLSNESIDASQKNNDGKRPEQIAKEQKNKPAKKFLKNLRKQQ